jgi:LTXXQ motif family protein
MVQARLDQAAARLEIRASQEPAWNAFAAAVRTAFAAPPAAAGRTARAGNPPEDAAALLHRLAAAEAARARNLTQLADATTKLQAALDPNQREVLDQVVRTQLRGDMGGFGFPRRRVVRIRRMPGAGFAPPAQFKSFDDGGPDAGPGAPRSPPGDPAAPAAPDPAAP